MGPPHTRFFRTTTWLMSWPDWERYLFPQQCLVVTLLLSLVSTLVFSRTGDILSHLSSSTHRFPRFPPSNLCFYVMLGVFSLARTQLSFKLLSPQDWQNRESFLQRLRTPLISFCTVQLWTLCVTRSLAIFCLSTTSVPGPVEFPHF